MPNYATGFSAATAVTSADLVQIVQSGTDKSATAALLATYFRTPVVQQAVSAATVTPSFSSDMVILTAQAAPLAVANPTGTASQGLGVVFRIKDDGTSRAITWGSQYRAIGVSLPSSTVVGKQTYVGCIWNVEDSRMDVVAVGTES